jgi:hypothetical protein
MAAAKKRRTAKQKAATRKLVALNKRRKKSGTKKGMRRKTARRAFEGIRKTAKKVRKSKPLKRRKPTKSMARGKILSSPILKKAALGVGGATIAGIAAAALFPQFRNVAEPAGAYLFGGIEGIAANFALSFMKGRSGTTAQNAAPAMEVL